MNRQLAGHSKLPAFLIPCPGCGGRMAIRLIKPAPYASDVEDITHRCDGCGAELTRTVKICAEAS
jgi:C4-type Zn-finger protein